MRMNDEINQAMKEVHTTTAFREVLTRLLGVDHPHLSLLAELAPAVIVHRTIFGEHLDPETFSERVLALIHDLEAEPSR